MGCRKPGCEISDLVQTGRHRPRHTDDLASPDLQVQRSDAVRSSVGHLQRDRPVHEAFEVVVRARCDLVPPRRARP